MRCGMSGVAQQLIRSGILFLLVALVAACTSSHTTSSRYQSEPDPVAEAAYQSEARAVASDIASRLVTICMRQNSLVPAWAESQSTMAVPQCYREKIEAAFNEPDGVTACADTFSIGQHFVCLAMGSYLNDLRRNMGSPKHLSLEEWRDVNLAVKNTNAEIVVQSLVACAKTGTGDRQPCADTFLLHMFGLDAQSGEVCKRQAQPENCLMRKSVVAFMRTRAMLIW